MKVIMEKQKRIALIAHDHLKDDLVRWCVANKDELKKHFLSGTGTTSRLIAEGEIDMMIFFWDPLEAQPHDPDIKALLRIAVVYDIPVASNRATADFLMNSKFMNGEYSHELQDFHQLTEKRAESMKKEFS